MNIQAIEEAEFTHSTPAEWDRAEARDIGEHNPDQQWVLTDRDVWHENPFYQGPNTPHPEEYDDNFDAWLWWLFEAERPYTYQAPRPTYDTDIPF